MEQTSNNTEVNIGDKINEKIFNLFECSEVSYFFKFNNTYLR